MADIAIISQGFSLHTMVLREYISVFQLMAHQWHCSLLSRVTFFFWFIQFSVRLAYLQGHAGFRTSIGDSLVLRGTFWFDTAGPGPTTTMATSLYLLHIAQAAVREWSLYKFGNQIQSVELRWNDLVRGEELVGQAQVLRIMSGKAKRGMEARHPETISAYLCINVLTSGKTDYCASLNIHVLLLISIRWTDISHERHYIVLINCALYPLKFKLSAHEANPKKLARINRLTLYGEQWTMNPLTPYGKLSSKLAEIASEKSHWNRLFRLESLAFNGSSPSFIPIASRIEMHWLGQESRYKLDEWIVCVYVSRNMY